MFGLILGVSINAAMLSQCTQPQYNMQPDVIGTASSPDTGETYYVEEYYYDYCAGDDLVLYKETGKLLTWKIISDSRLNTAPGIEQFDTRHGEHIRTDWVNGKLELKYRKNNDAEFKKVKLAPSEDQVIDAGFDQYVKNNWPTLVNFKLQDFDYASPPMQTNINLRIRRMDENQCRDIIENTDQHICFKIEANNLLFRVFSKPIKLVYDYNQRLKIFYGVTNILNQDGNNYFAEINYEYLTKGDPE